MHIHPEVSDALAAFLLDFFHRQTRRASLAANVALVLSNAWLAAQIAAAYATFTE